MTLNLELALEDVGALLSGPSFLTADPMGPLLDQDEDEEEALSPSSFLEGRAPPSPPLSFSSYVSSSPPYTSLSSSPLSFPSFLGDKARTAGQVSFPWLAPSELLDAHVRADTGKDDAFSGMDWMTEKIDLSDLDLESLIGSCASDEPPSSPEELLASLENNMDLDLDAFDAAPPGVLGLGLPLPDLPSLPLELALARVAEVEAEVEAQVAAPPDVVPKAEPLSPVPSPADTLALGSEVDVSEADKTSPVVTATVVPGPNQSIQAPIVLSLPPSAHFVVVLTPKDETPQLSTPPTTTTTISISPLSSDCDSDSGIESASGSSPHQSSPSPSASFSAGSSRTKPYSKPDPNTPSTPKSPKVKSVSGAPKVVEKKLKKMEQNKTAATRYRQKKRAEQEVLLDECADLEKRNRELAEKADSISREIQYLKDLMEEVRSAKNRRTKASSGV
ncbi:cyclic AMP-dependent transcription factor ATF-4 [Aplochiton taeniatus]